MSDLIAIWDRRNMTVPKCDVEDCQMPGDVVFVDGVECHYCFVHVQEVLGRCWVCQAPLPLGEKERCPTCGTEMLKIGGEDD